MKFLRNVFLALALFIAPASYYYLSQSSVPKSQTRNRILESSSFHDVLTLSEDRNFKSEDILVVSDIDNTLMKSSNLDGLGSDLWFSAIWKTTNNLKKILPVYFELQKKHLKFALVDNSIPSIIKNLRKKGVKVVALTARSSDLQDSTIENLKSLGLDFTVGSLAHEAMEGYIDYPWHYKNGIMFCQLNDKGKVLDAFFKKVGYKPKKVIFIDDKIKYVRQLSDHMNKLGIDFAGIRYSKMDRDVENFNLDKANEHLRLLGFEKQLKDIYNEA